LDDAPYDREAAHRIVAEVSGAGLDAAFSGAERGSAPESGRRPFRFRELETVEEAKPLLDAAGLPSTALVVALETDPSTGASAGAVQGLPPTDLLAAGTALERLRLALAVEGFGVVSLPPSEPSHLALIAVGAAAHP